MRVSKKQISADIKGLAVLLAPFGITNSEQLAALLRDSDSYPSGAYIRLMLSPWDAPDPSERFCDRFYLLKEYVERSLIGDHQADLLVTLDRVIVRDHYDPSQKIRFVVSGDGHLKPNEIVMVREEAGVPEGASQAGPRSRSDNRPLSQGIRSRRAVRLQGGVEGDS